MASNPTARMLSRLRPVRWLPQIRPSPTVRSAAPLHRQPVRHASRYSERTPSQEIKKARADAGFSNPYDDISKHRSEIHRRQEWARRRKFLVLGAVLSMAAPVLIINLFDIEELAKSKADRTDAPSDVTKEFQGRKVVVAPGGEKLQAVGESGATIELIETGTSSVPVFPKTIKLPSDAGDAGAATGNAQTEYTLLGLGIRTVSFLSIQVYVVGLYVETTALGRLQAALVHRINETASALIPGEKDELRRKLLDPEQSNLIWESLLRDPSLKSNMAIRVVPTRDTNFAHLRDGLFRGITKRMQEADLEARKNQTPSEFGDEAFGAATKEFKALFDARGKAAKGDILVLRRGDHGAVDMFFQATGKKEGELGPLENCGRVQDERISRLLWLLYLGGKNVSSEGARKSVVDGCLDLVERPIGTVETRVA
ncbi:chalcone-flavanone isomerase-domain-containing protein [Phyllosticta citrichinensis]|uniref:Chalcone-flavanone isomerase-domain-containing protein n=1 Tax=Phyllosticta citrichinensis TaxID=1130410 RepID=A0ABR1XGM5_9PEZI